MRSAGYGAQPRPDETCPNDHSIRAAPNFFYLDPDVPYGEYRMLDASRPEMCRVIPADLTRAVQTAAPEPARSYPARPVHAAEVTMLPEGRGARMVLGRFGNPVFHDSREGVRGR